MGSPALVGIPEDSKALDSALRGALWRPMINDWKKNKREKKLNVDVFWLFFFFSLHDLLFLISVKKFQREIWRGEPNFEIRSNKKVKGARSGAGRGSEPFFEKVRTVICMLCVHPGESKVWCKVEGILQIQSHGRARPPSFSWSQAMFGDASCRLSIIWYRDESPCSPRHCRPTYY